MKDALMMFAVVLIAAAATAWWRGRAVVPPPQNERVETADRVSGAGVRAPTPADVEDFLRPYRVALEASERPVLRVGLEPMTDDPLTVSKLGGRGYWPREQALPTGVDGRPLFLLAQINFAELPKIPGYPAQGLLQFYIAATDFYGANFEGEFSPAALSAQRNWRAVYWADTSAPADDRALLQPPEHNDLLPHQPDRPRRMRFELGREQISFHDYRFEQLLGGNLYRAAEAYAEQHELKPDDFVDALWELRSSSGHQIGGYPYFTQQDPRTEGRLELLLQLDTEDEFMMWGDSGVAGFFIDPDDLARADFSRVMYSWDCH